MITRLKVRNSPPKLGLHVCIEGDYKRPPIVDKEAFFDLKILALEFFYFRIDPFRCNQPRAGQITT